MIGLIAQRRWFIAAILAVMLFAALAGWVLAPAHGLAIAALGAALVLALGAGALGFARAAAARRALAGDMEIL
ncbi:MAG TPA: hypothetical protein PLS69_11720, partial [Terricaulis sp.]|nr:hypothetical protein [Terricaulis sp.]